MSARALCVSIHDVAPATWAACRTLAEAVAEVDPALPLTLLVVPAYHGCGDEAPAWYRAWLAARMARGDEVALHGYTHFDEMPVHGIADYLVRRCYTAGEGEFAALSREAALRRIAFADAWCARHGLQPRGFVAPAWLMSRGTWEALPAFDFDYTTTLRRFHLLRERRSIPSASLVYSSRAAWRRWTSRRWNARVAARSGDAPLVRLGLHPADAQHADVVAHVQRMLDAVRRDRRAFTKAEFAALAARSRSL